MTEEKDYTAGVPTTPPDGLLDWLIGKGALSKNAIVYRSDYVTDEETSNKTKVVYCTCTACKRSFHEKYVGNYMCHSTYWKSAPFGFINHMTNENVISSNTTMCPECASPVEALHLGDIYGERGRMLVDAYPMSVHRINGLIYLLSWRVAKWVDKSGKVSFETNPYEGYAFDGRKAVKIVGYSQFFSYRYTGQWEQRVKCVDTYGEATYVYPFDADILTGTSLENSKLNIFAGAVKEPALIAYLKIFQKHKNVENLVMQGASVILQDKIKETRHHYYWHKGYTSNVDTINWKAKRPSEMLGLNREEFRLCVENEWTLSKLNLYLYAKENGILLSEDEVEFCSTFGQYIFKTILECDRPRNVSVLRCLRYLKKQKQKNVTMGERELIDYWKMSRKLGDELVRDADIFPQSLQNAHDACTDRINAINDAKRDAKFKERFDALSIYDFEYEGLCIRPPRTTDELRKEGKTLGHCVFSYADSHVSGKTAILFIRHINEPDEPYFTLELDEKKLSVRQNRGKCNCARTEEVVVFEEKWLNYIHKKYSKKKEKVTA